MCTIENLPYELIAIIGDLLTPKWRLRLFLCRKEWSRECIGPQRDLFNWHKKMQDIIGEISNIKYESFNCYEVGCVLIKLKTISKRTLYNHEIYYTYTRCFYGSSVISERTKTISYLSIENNILGYTGTGSGWIKEYKPLILCELRLIEFARCKKLAIEAKYTLKDYNKAYDELPKYVQLW